jgi:hypothetical protein
MGRRAANQTREDEIKKHRLWATLVLGTSLTLAALLFPEAQRSAVRADPGVRYVSLDGDDSRQCGSVADRCRTVQRAVDAASTLDEIWVAQGTYTGSGQAVVAIDRSLAIYGGWDGVHAGVRDASAYPTTLDGQGARQGVLVGDGLTVTLEGFTVTNGVAPVYGAGLYARDAYLTLRDMAFDGNVISTTLPEAYGGGAMVEGGTLLADGCVFRTNSAWATTSSSGGGLAISATLDAIVESSLFEDNDAWFGSGMYFFGNYGGGEPLAVRNCRFFDNGWQDSPGQAYGGYAGALGVIGGKARVEDNVFVHNQASNGRGAIGILYGEILLARNVIRANQSYYDTSGVSLAHVSPFTATNNLIVENESTYSWELHQAVGIVGGTGRMLHNTIARNGNTYGIKLEGGATVALTNTILVSHTVGITVEAGAAASLDGTLWGSGPWANAADWGGGGSIVTGTLNIWDDPAFADPAAGDYHITAASAAVDRGLDAGVADDVDGEARPHDGDGDGDAGWDIGADELAEYIYLPLALRNH